MRIAIAACGLTLAACGSSRTDGYYSQPLGPPQVLSVNIDTGAQVTSDPGKGVGVSVEYAAGGQWRVRTTCDTDINGYTCRFDIIATVASTHALAVTDQALDLETPDRVLRVDDGGVRLVFHTDSDTDSVGLSASPGDALELDIALDDAPDLQNGFPSTLSWFGDGVLHQGAPTNPVDLLPTAP